MFPELFTQPTAYFEERVKYPTLKVQLLIVCLVGLAANVWRIRLIDQLGAAAVYFEDLLYIFTGVGIIEFVLWWLILTFVMHAMATLLGGRSSYGDLLRLTGFSFWPMILTGAIFSIGWTMALADADAPNEVPRYSSFREQFKVYSQWLTDTAEVYSDPVLLGAIALGSFFVIATGVLWTRSVQIVADLDEPRAAIAAGTAVLIMMFRIFQPILTASSEGAFAL